MRKAVPPNPVDSSNRPGLRRSPTGAIPHEQMDDDFARNVWKMQNPISLACKAIGSTAQSPAEQVAVLDGETVVICVHSVFRMTA